MRIGDKNQPEVGCKCGHRARILGRHPAKADRKTIRKMAFLICPDLLLGLTELKTESRHPLTNCYILTSKDTTSRLLSKVKTNSRYYRSRIGDLKSESVKL